MSSDYQEYPDVVQEVRGALNPGRLKFQGNSIVFKNTKTGKVDQFQGTDIDQVKWLKRARGYCLKIVLHSGHIHRFDGFKEVDQEKLGSFISRNYNTKLETVDLSVKGWNWGQAKFEGNGLNFVIDNNLAFEIPLNNVSHTTTAKNEITLEFHQNDDAAVSLMELRFHIPGDPANQEKDTVNEFYNQVMENADIIQATGDAVCVFPEVQCLTPRGRYDIKMYTTFLQLHGKTFDYKVPYTSVLRLFLLPHKDGRQIFFVVSLDPPIKQGQTRYHFLILLFYKDDEMTLECGLGDELEEKYEGKLQKEMNGPEYEIVSKVFKAVTTRKITVPGSFLGHSGTPAIGCSYKAATGLLYPLERGFIFVHKPPVHIRFDELAAVNFARSAGSTRSFDFDVETKAGNVYTFSNIEKDEYGKLFEFAKNKNLRMKNIGNKKNGVNDYDAMMDSDDEDGGHDAYLERMKAEGKDRDSDALDDDSDSSDEDFRPEDSASDVAEEYDSNPPTTSESDEDASDSGGEQDEEKREEKRKEKERRKQEKREQREKTKSKSKSAKTVREGGSKKKKKKEDRDPNKPKRPQTAYFLWFMSERENIKSENPGFSVVDISKKAGELWKGLSPEDKKPFDLKAREAKEEYDEAMKEYNKKLREEGPPKTSPKEKKAKKSKSSPKKPAAESKAGSGGSYKSKEFISESESSSSSSGDEDDRPLKKLKAGKKEKKEKMEVDESGSESEDEKPTGVKRRSQRKEGEESDVGSLPDEEEILSSPEHSDPGEAASGSDSD
ncbi:FACT complex subunit SSRP1-like isoform X1 [Mercenaria mercenaria]|uniref:FACT complex subunit SSRP1-like isoform X1 n=1 Tax=Mercenaria mercenaria TaxID=6596 RepID=UPI00234F7DEE|nr:FACT complex subunit SSRP1-like isoform X1 [Mercenaria mercenaria]